jgi:hypothetical protein
VLDADAFLVKVQSGVAPAAVQKLIDGQYGVGRSLTIQSNAAVKAQAVAGATQAFALPDDDYSVILMAG